MAHWQETWILCLYRRDQWDLGTVLCPIALSALSCVLLFSWAGEWDDGCPVWVENLNRTEIEINNLNPEVREKVQKALEACKRSQEAGEVGLSRLDEHWKTDSHIQRYVHT